MFLTAMLAAALSAGAAYTGDGSAPNLSRNPQPKGNSSAWLRDEDYPNTSGSGSVGFTLVVDTNGKAISCIVTSASGVPEFDAIVCDKIPRRARFTPAMDAKGQPTIGQWKSRARFGQSSSDIPIN